MKLRIITTAALTLGLLAGGTIAASAAPLSADGTTPTPPPTASSECQFGEHLVRLWLHLPLDLRADLKGLKDLGPGERGPAAREIRDGARGGEYGPGVQDRAERAQDRRIRVIANLPEELKADLRQIKAAAAEDRAELAKQLAETALAGGYGEKAQAFAERVQGSDFWQECVAK